MSDFKFVLVVEDSEMWTMLWKRGVNSEKIKLLFASSIAKAENFLKHFKFDAIVIDAIMLDENNIETTTFGLVKKTRSPDFGYTGPIIATSCSSEYQKKLIEAGCDYETPKEKFFQKLAEVLFGI